MGLSSQDFLVTALLRLGNQLISLKKSPLLWRPSIQSPILGFSSIIWSPFY